MDGAPDLIITDTSLLHAGLQPRAGAVAVKDGRIVAVGDRRGDAGTRRRHDRRACRCPGARSSRASRTRTSTPRSADGTCCACTSITSRTVEAYLEAIAAYAGDNPGEPWITGGGWAMYLFPGGAPRKEDLDRIVADRPVFLMNRDVHGAWVNSRALELAGSPRDTPDPWDGRIERDAMTGEPTGTLHEGAAYSFRDRFVPADRTGRMASSVARGAGVPPLPRDHRMAGRVGDAGHPRGVRRPGRGRRADHAGLGEPVVGPASGPGADRRTGRARSRGDERQRPRRRP